MIQLFVFRQMAKRPWFQALTRLQTALVAKEKEGVLEGYHRLYGALLAAEANDLPTAAAQGLLWEDSSLAAAAVRGGRVPEGLRTGALHDLETLLPLMQRSWGKEASRMLGRTLPPLTGLALPSQNADVASFAAALCNGDDGDARWFLDQLIAHYRHHGVGALARYVAFRWAEGDLIGITQPAYGDLTQLVDIDRQLKLLVHNTEAFLDRKPAQHVLLYGPRGSGKSTAVRSLLPPYIERGLRLVELPPTSLGDLPQVIEHLRHQPHRYILFVDDLSFGTDDASYSPLKTLLEGSLIERPDNMLVYATSNRRHLVKERFSDRPDPLDDEVHAWDSQHEKLALADRFGLTITFPDATQQRYLTIVRTLAEREALAGVDLEARAVRFADWGNGYSGRTARQFIDSLKAEMA